MAATAALYAASALKGAGATFPSPLYMKWMASYSQKAPSEPGIAYSATGSGAGITALRSGEVDFAASDIPLTDAQLAAFPIRLLHLPTVVGGVVPIYHLEGVTAAIRFTPETLAGIYLGTIQRWNDPKLKAANRGVALPNRPIAVIHRSDASGTTYIFTSYLSKVSPEWKAGPGASDTVKWPAGAGADKNEGVAEKVSATADSIGYVEFIYALQNHLSYGYVRNSSGRFLQATVESLTAAASAATSDLRQNLTDAPETAAYPIASFTWLLVPEKMAEPEKQQTLARFLRWMLTSGQKQCASLGYAPLPPSVAEQALKVAATLQ